MASRLAATILLLACRSAASYGDDTVLVQSLKLQATVSNASNASNATPAPTPLHINLYRFVFTQTYGDSYVCNTEIKFFDAMLKPLNASFYEQTSCYGCATVCGGCEQPYGNPLAQFDMIHNSSGSAVDGDLWSCTAQGSMPGGVGAQTVVFELSERPARYELHRTLPSNSSPKAWVLQEKEKWPRTGWYDISNVDDAPSAKMYGVDVLTNGQYESLVFPEVCSDDRTELTSDADAAVLDFGYTPQNSRQLQNNGRSVQVDGNFGTLELGGRSYNAKQLNFQFPTNRNIDVPEDGDALGGPVGELHILHESEFVIGKPQHLVVITILLKLPLEGSDASASEEFFRTVGLEDLPVDKEDPYMITSFIDLGTTFGEQMRNGYATLNCDDEDLTWLVLAQPAYCSAKVVQAFQERFRPGDIVDAPVVSMKDLTERAEAEAEEKAVKAGKPPKPVPLHAGRARSLPLNARSVAMNSGEYLAALKGGVTQEKNEDDVAPAEEVP